MIGETIEDEDFERLGLPFEYTVFESFANQSSTIEWSK